MMWRKQRACQHRNTYRVGTGPNLFEAFWRCEDCKARLTRRPAAVIPLDRDTLDRLHEVMAESSYRRLAWLIEHPDEMTDEQYYEHKALGGLRADLLAVAQRVAESDGISQGQYDRAMTEIMGTSDKDRW